MDIGKPAQELIDKILMEKNPVGYFILKHFSVLIVPLSK